MINSIYSALEKIKDCPDFIDLTDSNFARPEFYRYSKDIISKSVCKYLKDRTYIPDSKGLLESRKAINLYYQNRGIDLSPENILLTASTSESYNIILQALGHGSDEALIPNPGYPLFEYIFKYNRIQTTNYTLNYKNNWRIDFDSIHKNISKRTRFLIAISPNNPTGSVIPQDDFDQLFQICQDNKIFLIIDEVFISYTANQYRLPDITKVKTPIFILNGISKTFGLPDFKIGWIGVYGNKTHDIPDKLETANDTYLNANGISQAILFDLFKNIECIQAPIKEKIDTNRMIVKGYFPECLLEGGIHAFVKVGNRKHKDEESFVLDLLKNEHVLVYPGYFYDYSAKNQLWISFSYILPEEKLRDGLERVIMQNIL